MRTVLSFLCGSLPIALTTVVACGSFHPSLENGNDLDGGASNPNVSEQIDSGTVGPPDIVMPDGALTDSAAPFVVPVATSVSLSSTSPDQLSSVVAAPAGGFYAAGFVAEQLDGARHVVVVKLTPEGAVDTTWAMSGRAFPNMETTGGSGGVRIGVQPNGKIIVAATIPNFDNPNDSDIGVAQLTADGTPVSSFAGGKGVRVLDLSTALESAANVKDLVRAIAIATDGSIFIHAGARSAANASRTDLDFVVAKLDADGNPANFGNSSRFVLDIAQESAVPRDIVVLPDGSVIAVGYASSSLVGGSPQPVVYKLSASGTLLETPFYNVVLEKQTEAYGIALHGQHMIVAGYGKNTGETTDWVTMKFDITTLTRDTTFGNADKGAVIFDIKDTDASDYCRSAIALPDGKTLLVGSTGMSNEQGEMDAAFAVITEDGSLDVSYGKGRHFLSFGGVGNDQLWSAAISGTTAMMVGFRGQMTQTSASNDDAFVVALPLR